MPCASPSCVSPSHSLQRFPVLMFPAPHILFRPHSLHVLQCLDLHASQCHNLHAIRALISTPHRAMICTPYWSVICRPCRALICRPRRANTCSPHCVIMCMPHRPLICRPHGAAACRSQGCGLHQYRCLGEQTGCCIHLLKHRSGGEGHFTGNHTTHRTLSHCLCGGLTYSNHVPVVHE